MKTVLAASELHNVLTLDGASGSLAWKRRPVTDFAIGRKKSADQTCRSWNTRYAGKPAFTSDNGHGYRCGAINHVNYLAHRVAFALANGRWPEKFVDHIDGDRGNNRPSNLREATGSQNQHNSAQKGGISAFKGVSFDKRHGRWRSYIRVSGVQISLGYHAAEGYAADAYDQAAARHFGAFARMNKVENADAH